MPRWRSRLRRLARLTYKFMLNHAGMRVEKHAGVYADRTS